VDSWAWIEYFSGSVAGATVERATTGNEIWTSAVSIAEIVSKYRRSQIDEGPPIRTLLSISRVSTPDENDAQEAGRVHAETKNLSPNFGLADSFVLQLARKLGCKVLTGDPDFRRLKEAQFIV